MSEFKSYPRVGSIEARPYVPGENLRGISVSTTDGNRATLEGGFIARNPDNHTDQWYIAPEYFAKHYGSAPPVDSGPCWCPYCGEPHGVARRADNGDGSNA